MRLKYKFQVRTLMDEIIAFPAGNDAANFGGVLALNETGAEIFQLLQQEMDEAAIIAKLQERYGSDDEKLPSYVSAFLDKLQQAGVVE